jgi:VanZ family protein
MVRVLSPSPSIRWFWAAAAIALAAAIFYQSSQPSIRLQDQPLNVVFGDQRTAKSDEMEDTGHIAAHLGLYGALAFCLHRALGRPGLGAAAVAVALATAYGVSDEWHQSLGDTRSGSVYDVVTDFLGAALGTAASASAGVLWPAVRRSLGRE